MPNVAIEEQTVPNLVPISSGDRDGMIPVSGDNANDEKGQDKDDSIEKFHGFLDSEIRFLGYYT